MARSANITNQAINPNSPFDMAKDFAPIALVNTAAVVLVVHPSIKSTACRTDRAGEVEARRAALCLNRRRHCAASCRRAVRAARRHQARARPLSGQPAGGDRSHRRPGQHDVLAGLGRGRADRSRQASMRSRPRRTSAPASCPTADHGGGRHARLRHHHLVRPVAPAGTPGAIIDKLAKARGGDRGAGGADPAASRVSIRSAAGRRCSARISQASSSAGSEVAARRVSRNEGCREAE